MSGTWDESALTAAEALRLTTFTSETAFELGVLIRDRIRSQFPGKGAIVDIRAAQSEQQLFFAASDEGSLPDNAQCVLLLLSRCSSSSSSSR